MADYKFYVETYVGGSIPAEEFPRMAARASEQLGTYKRSYTVTAPSGVAEDMAICAMADALYYYEMVANGLLVTSSSIGSVSSSAKAPDVDISPRGQAAELLRCAKRYLDIYRGCR